MTGRRSSCDTARELRRGRERAFLHDDHRPGRTTHRRPRRPLDDQRAVPPTGERLQEEPLLALEAVRRTLTRRAVQAYIGHALEPGLPLLIEIGIMQERATVDEIAAEIADRALDAAIRLLEGPAEPDTATITLVVENDGGGGKAALNLLISDAKLVEAAGVEREHSAIMNRLMARDFWG